MANPPDAPSLLRACVAESVGTAALLIAIIGSGIMGERLAGGNAAIALLANSIATGLALWVLIATLGPISGAHFNPAVSLVGALAGLLSWRRALGYMAVQVPAALLGVLAAHAMFDLPLLSWSTRDRSGEAQLFSEAIATAGLIGVVAMTRAQTASLVGGLVGAYITAAYWFTASTSFANPAVTIARSLTDTFSGIRPADVAPFVVVQLTIAAIAGLALRRFTRP